MRVKRGINNVLRRATGYQLVRASRGPRPVVRGDRLLRAPVFIMAPVRSGSTLLRAMLDSHSMLYAPHEVHLNDIHVELSSWFSRQAAAELGFSDEELTSMLWDRMLHAALAASGKRTLVEKTPNHLFMHRRIAATWRDARFIFLLRHPGSVYRSWCEARPGMARQEAVADTLRYLRALESARDTLTGTAVRYEDLTSDPVRETRRLCAYLRVPWEPGMIDYGGHGHARFKRGLGDWSGKINSGRPRPGRSVPTLTDTPVELHDLCRAWGYAAADSPARPG